MEDRPASLDENNLRLLRNSLEKISIHSDLRRKLIGGLSEEDVANYIEGVRKQCQILEDELTHNIEELQSSKERLRKEFNGYKQRSEEERKRLQEALDQAGAKISKYSEEHREKDEKYNIEVKRLFDENHELDNENSRLAEKISLLEKEMEDLRANINEYTNENSGYIEEIASLEKELESNKHDLDERTQACLDLERKLEYEKSCGAALNKDINMMKEKTGALEAALKETQSKYYKEMELRKKFEKDFELEKNKVINCTETVKLLETKTGELEEQLRENILLAEEQQKIREDLEQQLQSYQEIMENSNYNTINFKGDVDVIYKQLDNIKEQININENLQQQIDFERSRAEKVEKDMSQFGEWMYELKEKFKMNQKELQTQFAQIEEKHKAMESDINGLRTNIESFSIGTGKDIEKLCETIENANNAFINKCVKIDQYRDKEKVAAAVSR